MRAGRSIKGELLAGVELFSDLDLAAREMIAAGCTAFDFAAGEVILAHNDTSRDLFFVLSGVVEVSLYSVNGRRTSFDDKGPGEVVGELAALDGRPRSAYVVAKTDCRTVAIPPDDFFDIVATHPSVARRLLHRMTRQIRVLSERVFEFDALYVNNRIHVELLRCARAATADGCRRLITPAPTHAEIASRVSTHREAVTRELGQLTKTGVIEKGRDTLIVTDIGRLEDLVEQSLGEIPIIC